MGQTIAEALIEEGKAIERAKNHVEMMARTKRYLLKICVAKLGEPNVATAKQYASIAEWEQLDLLEARLEQVSTWAELFATPK